MNDNLKICLANDSFPPQIDGVINTVTNYARIIKRDYGDTIVAVPKYPNAVDDYPFEVVRYASINTTKLVGYRTGFPFAFDAMRKLSEFKPDIIHSHCPLASNLLARELRELTGAPLILTYHTKFDIDIKRAIKLGFLQEPAIRVMVDSINACDEVWAVNQGAADNLYALGYDKECVIMKNGVDFPLERADSSDIRAEYSLQDGVPVFLFVGRIIWYKGLRIIVDALTKLREEGVAFRMFFVGKGDDEEELKQLCKDRGIWESCVFTGAVYDRERLRKFYSSADMFLLPSVFDNNPIVIKEAAASYTASVLIDGSSSAEEVVNGENGILISEKGDELGDVLLKLCSEPGIFKKLGTAAANTLYYSWDDSVKNAVAEYRNVLDRRDKGLLVTNHSKLDLFIERAGELFSSWEKARKYFVDPENRF